MKKILCVAALWLAAGTASAGLVTYDFTGGSIPTFGDPISYSESGLGLDVSGTPGVAVDTTLGLGVKNGRRDDWQVDGDGPDETLSFLFDQNVDLVSVYFTAVGSNDDFSLSIDGGYVGGTDIPGGNFWQPNHGTFDFTSYSLSGTLFDFSVRGWNDDYYIGGITVNTVGVPEPASLALLGLGLAGLGLCRIKAKA